MCKTKMKTDATEPRPRSSVTLTPSSGSYNYSSSSAAAAAAATNPPALEAQRFRKATSTSSDPSLEYERYNTTGTGSSSISGSTSSVSSSRLRNSLPGSSYVIYDSSEISTATNNFLAKRIASSSSAWRCSLRGKEVIVFQRSFRRLIDPSELHERLSLICKSHHMSLIKLFGASISAGGGGDHIYLVYDFVSGANLRDCLRNPRNPGFTVLSSWVSRMQIAIDLAQGLEYIHHYIAGQGHVHNHIKSSSLIITEPSFNAKICHFGTAQLCGETYDQHQQPKLKRSDSRNMKFQGTRGYMSPEYQSGGSATQKSDVFAFGVLVLELLSGEEPLKYIFNRHTGDYRRLSLAQTAKQALDSDQLRRWMDTRLKDSFPVEVADKMTRLALDCVHSNPDNRPDMRHVAGKMSKLYIMSAQWADRIKPPTDISLSLGPR